MALLQPLPSTVHSQNYIVNAMGLHGFTCFVHVNVWNFHLRKVPIIRVLPFTLPLFFSSIMSTCLVFSLISRAAVTAIYLTLDLIIAHLSTERFLGFSQ